MKCKGFIIGVIVGALSVGSIVVADNYYNIEPNPYKIFVNGEEKQIEGYNINDYSYFKLRDIGEYVGFTVDFKEDTIMIESNDKENGYSDIEKGEYPYVVIDGSEYISCINVISVCDTYGTNEYEWSFAYIGNNSHTGDGHFAYLSKVLKPNESTHEYVTTEEYKIQCEYIDANGGEAYITREVFENEILARIQG